MIKTNKPKAQPAEADPLERAEAFLKELKTDADAAILSLKSAVGREAQDSALVKAIAASRRSYAFGHALSQITKKPVYRISEKPLRDLKIQARSILIPPTPLPDEALEVLEVLKATLPPPKVFEGETEYQQWLEGNGMHEVIEEDDYQSQTAQRSRFPSDD